MPSKITWQHRNGDPKRWQSSEGHVINKVVGFGNTYYEVYMDEEAFQNGNYKISKPCFRDAKIYVESY